MFMTYTVSGGALNSTHLTHCNSGWVEQAGSNLKAGCKSYGLKLNCPIKNGNINVQNHYDALSNMEEDYYGADQNSA